MKNHLDTEPYKGTRDFYPEDMAVERYLFSVWAKVAESFGFERYDASILEPAELYKAKGAENEELVREQTYTFTDRGNREVTLRPEMTPSVARMIAGRRRDLNFPVRWYSIPNLFRYERPQRGRLREHWQFNCDIFGVDHYSADVELIALAAEALAAFGATPDMFEVRINDRALMHAWYRGLGLSDDAIVSLSRIVDRRDKVKQTAFSEALEKLVPDPTAVLAGLDASAPSTLGDGTRLDAVIEGLRLLGISNVRFDASLARGFDYYTGVVFELFDTSPKNNRSIAGGGRYDNLTELFGGEPITGVGFGMGDVVIHDFLETHGLLDGKVARTAPTLVIIPTDVALIIEAQKLAREFRHGGVRVAVDIGDRKLGKKITSASDAGVRYVLIFGEDELASQNFILKELATTGETKGSLSDLIRHLS